MAERKIPSRIERLREKPYERRVCRSEHYPHCLPGGENEGFPVPSMEEHLDLMQEVGLEVQIISGEHDRGTPRFPSKMLPPQENCDFDLIPRFLDLAHQGDILVIAYYPMIYTKPLKKLHPEWMMRWLDDGRPRGLGPSPENLGWFCFNSPYRDWIIEYLSEYLDHLDLDGFFFDDMNWGSHEGQPLYTACCCAYCREIFLADTGLKIPEKVDFESVDFRRFVAWRYDKVRDFLAHVVRAVRERHPYTIMDFNYYGEQAQWNRAAPFNPLGLDKVGGYFFIESGWANVEHRGSFSAKIARAHGSPFALWRSSTQTLSGSCWGFPPHAEPYSPTAYGLTAVAHGGAFFFAGMQYALSLRRDLMKFVFSEIKRRAEFMDGETVKYVGLHFSQSAMDFLPAEPKFSDSEQGLYDTEEKRQWAVDCKYVRSAYARGVKSTCDMLVESQLLTDLIFDEQLEAPTLSPYRVLFLSNSSCLSNQQCGAIRGFVKEGGTLIATHETSLLDELGRRRPNFALADLFGLDYCGPAAKDEVHGVLYVLHDRILKRNFGQFMCFTGRESLVALRKGGKAEVLATQSSLMGPNPVDQFDPGRPCDSGVPAVVVHQVGKGRVIYLNGDVGGSFESNPYPALKRFVACLVERAAPPISVVAPRVIEVTAATVRPGEMVIHLLNNPAPSLPAHISPEEASTYFYQEEVIPVCGIEITFTAFQVKSARMPLAGVELDVVGGPPRVTIPQVDLHEVVTVELG